MSIRMKRSLFFLGLGMGFYVLAATVGVGIATICFVGFGVAGELLFWKNLLLPPKQ